MEKRWSVAARMLAVGLCFLGSGNTACRADAGEGLGDMVFTAGTVASDVHGREWAYVTWMATDPELLMGIQYDIYAKDGAWDAPGAYEFKGSSMLQTDPAIITILANRAVHLGDDLDQLETAIDELFAEAIPDPGLELGEKIAAVIEGSAGDPAMFENLVFMSHAYPAMALAVGRGFACTISPGGLTTLEIRDHNTTEVIGRITLEAGAPVVLPAPAGLVQVDDPSPKGHLNIRLRWESPDELKRLSLLQFGHHIYRFPKDFAEAEGLHTNPPPTAVLLDYVANEADVVRVNRIPVLTDEASVETNT